MSNKKILTIFFCALIYIFLTIFPSVLVVASSPIRSLENASQTILPVDDEYKIQLNASKYAENGAAVGVVVNILKVADSDSVKSVKSEGGVL